MFVLGIVPYLNAVPLVAPLEGRAVLRPEVPARLSALLASGEVDAALLPVAEAIRGVGDGYLGAHGITSAGAVASVLLFLRCPLERVGDVVLDRASRTSAGLARYLVQRRAQGEVRFAVSASPGPDPHRTPGDAVLVIGDPALGYARSWTGPVLDLGEVWTQETGLPFVYARWTARAGLEPAERLQLATLLDEAARVGARQRAALARAWAATRGEDPEAAERYVLRHVGHEIGPREEEGLARYAAILHREAEARVREARHA